MGDGSESSILEEEALRQRTEELGFVGSLARKRFGGGAEENSFEGKLERELEPISVMDMGLVVVGEETNYSSTYIESARMSIRDGIPMQDSDQMSEYRYATNVARNSGREKPLEPRPLLYIPVRGSGGVGDRRRAIIMAFPGNILRWSMGAQYSENKDFPNPFPSEDTYGSFDLRRNIFNPDIQKMQPLGYSEEGINRLLNLSLMTELISCANGAGRLRVSIDKCQVAVEIREEEADKASLISENGHKVKAFLYSLNGVNAVLDGDRVVELSQIKGDDFKQERTALVKAAELSRSLLIKDVNGRQERMAGVSAALELFKK